MTTKQLKRLLGSVLIMLFVVQVSVAQTYNLSNATSTLRVDGTSNLHDWDIKAENQKGKISVELDNGKVTKIQDLSFTVLTESLKSGKSGMDKNTHKALQANKHKEITFKLTNVKNIDCGSSGNCKVTVTGNLSIAGKTKPAIGRANRAMVSRLAPFSTKVVRKLKVQAGDRACHRS